MENEEISKIKKGDKIIVTHSYWGKLRSFVILEVAKALKTKIIFTNGKEVKKIDFNTLIIYNDVNLKKVKQELKEVFKIEIKLKLKEDIQNSNIKLEAYKEVIAEIEKSFENKVL